MFKYLAISLVALFTLACSGEIETAKGGWVPPTMPVDWEMVPSYMNPEIKESRFSLSGVRQIDIDFHNFEEDFRVILDEGLQRNEVLIKRYTVRTSKSKTTISKIHSNDVGGALELTNTGAYSCQKKVMSKYILELRGACYIRVEVLLPLDSDVEVYNLGELQSPRMSSAISANP